MHRSLACRQAATGVFSPDGSGGMGDGEVRSSVNAVDVQANKNKLFEMESVVEHNKFQAYAIRALIEENRHDILGNYVAAMGNRTMTNHNTADIFQNRIKILSGLKVEGTVQENFVQSKINESFVDYLDHRSKMNARVSSINQELSEINTTLIEANSTIMEGNQEIADFNTKHVEINRTLLEGELKPSSATPESNAERIRSNTSRMNDILDRAISNGSNLDAQVEKMKANRERIRKNDELIHERRDTITQNHLKIGKNRDVLSGKGSVRCTHTLSLHD